MTPAMPLPSSRIPAVSLERLAQNRLLASLSAAERQLLLPGADIVELAADTLLVDSGDDVVSTYFPISGMIAALVLVMADGTIAEAATIGREGAIGGVVSAGHKPAFARTIVQLPGSCLRIDTARLEAAKAKSPRLHDLFARYADALLAQVLQSVVCNALHPLDQRCCRWLLSTMDRVGSNELKVTQEFLAQMLGVQRTTMTRTLRDLSRCGLIRQARGRIIIQSREGLEGASCDCHASVRRHFRRILPEVPTRP
ncbi:MAG TPA: Crp/Fnr family transcriptional regulator [Geminicoccus sp.]|uniref:Crp/Fnr family transcriptional regulator n=1 Tax=Geminicoccus sp. TaxID=2024832 RepID=UPI002BA8884E|nr:Crp/Fnr family transcriptional regulator [Geminicoccus sp.]HWL70658.1 Crp/Fnr family transcriptional regulator [Geminicoccus sp.]